MVVLWSIYMSKCTRKLEQPKVPGVENQFLRVTRRYEMNDEQKCYDIKLSGFAPQDEAAVSGILS